MSVCRSDFSVAHGGENDINRHMDTAKHKRYANAAQEQRKLTNFSASLATKNFGKKVVEVELNFSDFLIEHNLPLSTAGHSGKLFRNIFPNSKIVNKFQRCCTNTTNMLTGAVANQITSDLKEELLLTCQHEIATGGSRDEDDKFLLVLVRHVDKDSAMIVISLLDMLNTNSGSTAQQIYDVCNEVREAFPLDQHNWVFL